MVEEGSSFIVDMVVTNTGPMDANHSVLLYFIQHYRRITPEANRLLAFEKVFLPANASTHVAFYVHTDNFSYIGVDFLRVVETGLYTLAAGDPAYGTPSCDGDNA